MYDVYGFGKRIANYRKAADLTQEELANRLNITPQAVSKWENELSFPEITILPSLAKELDVTIEKLFGNEVSETKEKVFDHGFSDIPNNKTEYQNHGDEMDFDKTFKAINSLKVTTVSGQIKVISSDDHLTHVKASGSTSFIDALNVSEDEEVLSISMSFKKWPINLFPFNEHNTIIIAVDSQYIKSLSLKLNGSGDFESQVAFENATVNINGSGDAHLSDIANFECKINGSGNVVCSKIGNPTLCVCGSGDYDIKEVYGILNAEVFGSGDINLKSGEVDFLKASVSGSGNINAEHVTAKTANIKAHGSSGITIGRVIDTCTENSGKSSSVRILKRG